NMPLRKFQSTNQKLLLTTRQYISRILTVNCYSQICPVTSNLGVTLTSISLNPVNQDFRIRKRIIPAAEILQLQPVNRQKFLQQLGKRSIKALHALLAVFMNLLG